MDKPKPNIKPRKLPPPDSMGAKYNKFYYTDVLAGTDFKTERRVHELDGLPEYYYQIISRLIQKGDFKKVAAAARTFRAVVDDYDFKPNLFWGEDRDQVKTKPDLFTELIANLIFFHAVEDNLGNFHNNVGAVLINAGHINLFDAFMDISSGGKYYEGLWKLYIETIETAHEIKKRGVSGDGNLDKFETQALVIFFYEYFLEEYDKQLRKDMGVWYTPETVTTFINKSIQSLIREHFPDSAPYILDFATGTGTFMLDMINREYEKNKDIMDKTTLKFHLFNNISGVELNDMSFMLAWYNVNKLIYTLLGEYNGEIPVFDAERPAMLPLYNVNTLTTVGCQPLLGNNRRINKEK